MRVSGVRALASMAVAGVVVSCANAQEKQEKAADVSRPDAGKFVLTMQGMKVGTCTFKFDAEGGSVADIDVEAPGAQVPKFKVTVKVKGGKPVAMGADAGPTNNFTITREGGKAKLSVNGGEPTSTEVSEKAIPFGNISPHLINYMLAAYDSKKGGAQSFDLVLIEGLVGPDPITFTGKLESKGAKDVKVGDKTLPVTNYVFMVAAGGEQVEMKFAADKDRHLLAWEVPSQNYTAAREGFEAILKSK